MDGNSKFLEEKYGLKKTARIAFSDRTARKAQLEWWINREEEIDTWNRIVKQSTSLDKNYIVFIIGSYGRGKTLSLLKVTNEAEKYKEIFPIYLNFKGEEKTRPGLDFIFRILKTIDLFKLIKGKNEEEVNDAIEGIPELFEEPKSILSKIYFDEIDQPKQKVIVQEAQLRKRKEKSERSKLALFFLKGEVKPTVTQLKQLDVIRKIDNIDIAKEYLVAILCFVKNLGYKTLLLAIDEFEYLFSLVPKSQHSIYIALLRGLYDFPLGIDIEKENIANLLFFIGISEDGWGSLKELEKRETAIGGPTNPLLDRVDAKTTLGAFDKIQTRELIILRLKYNRVTGKFEKKSLIPFTEDFVDYIYELTRGEPRAITVRCGQVLEAGLVERVDLLNKNFAQTILEERGF
jgi:hypothetical protein